MKLPRWLSPGAAAFVVIWLWLMAGGRTGMLRDPGTFWHTRTGEIILHEGFIRSDPYTFTFGGIWWVPYQWLGEVGMALLHRLGGFDAQLLTAVTLISALFAWLFARLLRTGLNFVAVGGIVALGLAAAGSHFHVRPHLFTLTALAITTVLLVKCERPARESPSDRGAKPLARLFWLVPLFVVWTNIHGGLLGGLATLGITASGWVIFWRLGSHSPVSTWRHVGVLGLVGLGCGLSVLANPYGTDMVKTWRVIMDEPLLKQIIVEHRPLEPSMPYAWPIFGLAAVYIFVLAGVNWRETRVTWLLPLIWFVQTIDRCRHASLFVVVTLAVLPSLWPATRWATRLAKTRRDYYDPDTPPPPRPWWSAVWLPALVVSFSLALILGGVEVPVIGAGWAKHDPKLWPVALLDVIHANEPKPGEPNHLFTDYKDGGFAIYHAPGYKVFVDDRCEVFGGQWLMEFMTAANEKTPEAMAAWEKAYGKFDFALTTVGTGYDDYFRASPDWVCLKRTETAGFYKRK